MANRIKGITIEIGGDTTSLSKSLSGVNAEIKGTQQQLKDVEKLLKLDPKNIDLLKQREKLLNDEVKETKQKLEELKKAQDQMDAKGVDKNSDAYMALQREIIETTNALDDLEDKASKANATMNQVAAIANDVADGANKVADKTKALSAAAGVMLAGIGTAAYGAVTAADDLNTLAKQTGFTTEELQKMQYASDLIDVSMEDITSSAKKLKKNLTSTSTDVSDAFKRLGVSTRDANGSFRDSTEIYWDVITALSYVENETERDTLAMTLLGKNADSLAGIIDDGAASLNEYGDQAKRAGLILSQDTLDSLNSVNDKIDEIKATAKATLTETGAKAIEALMPAIEKVISLLSSVFEWIGSLDESQINMLVTILAIVAAISPIASIIGAIATAISALIPIIQAMNTAISGNPYIALITLLSALIIGLTYLIVSCWDEISAAFDNMFASMSAGINRLGNTIASAFQYVWGFITGVFNAISNTIKAIINACLSVIESGINFAIDRINRLISAFNKVASSVASFVGINYSGIGLIRNVSIPKMATGGTLYNGTALVGEAGPELLTVSQGRATVTPLTATVDGASLASALGNQAIATNVNIAFTGSLAQLARVLQPAIETETSRRGASMIK